MFNKSNLAVAGAISKNHYAQDVFFSKDGTIGTDGHIAVHVSMPEGDIADAPKVMGETPTADFNDFCVGVDDIKAVKKGLSKKVAGSFPILRNAFVIGKGAEKRLAATDLSSTVAVNTRDAKEAQYPIHMRDLKKVTPEGEPSFVIKFDGNLLGRFVSILNEAISGDYRSPIVFKFWANDKAVVAEAKRIETGQTITGLIVPMSLKD